MAVSSIARYLGWIIGSSGIIDLMCWLPLAVEIAGLSEAVEMVVEAASAFDATAPELAAAFEVDSSFEVAAALDVAAAFGEIAEIALVEASVAVVAVVEADAVEIAAEMAVHCLHPLANLAAEVGF
ncbi:hypothetical protein BGZ65_002940 [Modicella reniformis]|uniref:Uncharacterized protein n=1 Tax=Modicella reniformis TaxID=1440133 RepID=A0A9P6MI33_9FUNG|nr:hypothetical protein BGZ65_002940 [Modicella reniformis]